MAVKLTKSKKFTVENDLSYNYDKNLNKLTVKIVTYSVKTDKKYFTLIYNFDCQFLKLFCQMII